MRPVLCRLTATSGRRAAHASPVSRAATASAVSQPGATSSAPRPRTYVKRTPVPASAVSPPIARARPTPAPVSTFKRAAPTPAPVDAYDDPPFDAEDDHSQAYSGIDDYAHLAPPPQAQPRRAARVAPVPAAYEPAQPTPSPPMTSLPVGQSTIPLTTAPGFSDVGPAVANARQPDIQGEVSAPAGSDWSTSFHGLSDRPFDKQIAEALLRPLAPEDVEVKPDGLLYLPEIKYRRTLNAAFGPGGWGLAPRGETNVGPKIVSREWGLVCLGRLVSVARGEQEYFDPSGVATATEACKSNALMRCCKDLGIASELWDPRFIREFKAKHCEEAFVEHATTKRKRKLWKKKGSKFEYPYKEV